MPRVTVDFSDEHAEWLEKTAADQKRTKSEIVRDVLNDALNGGKEETLPPGRNENAAKLLAAIELLAHRYMIDHPKNDERGNVIPADERLIEFRKRYENNAENYDA